MDGSWEQGLASSTLVGGAPHGQALGRWPLAAIPHDSIHTTNCDHWLHEVVQTWYDKSCEITEI